MNHEMKLKPRPYAKIKSGSKTIELRLNDEKRQQVRVGDTITFSNMELPELKLRTKVVALHKFASFRELFEALPMEACGNAPAISVDDAVAEMRQYYSEEQEAKYGALGIEIELQEKDGDWTRQCNSRTVDIPAFIRRMDRMKRGESSQCPFCGGTVKMTVNEKGRTVFACDCCDMNIELESN